MQTGVAYFGNRMRHYVYQDMVDIKRSGFTYVVHTFSENDLLYYADSMRDIVQDAQGLGLQVYLDPWGVGGVFGGEAFSRWLVTHRDILQVRRNGTKADGACFNNPRFRGLIGQWLQAAAATGANGIIWDEPHWAATGEQAGGWCCACPVCRDLYGRDMPREINAASVAFRNAGLKDFLSFATHEAAALGLRNVVCLLPDEFFSLPGLEWSQVAALPDVHVLAADPYWYCFKQPASAFVRRYGERVLSLADRYHKQAQLWVQAFRVPPGREGEIMEAFAVFRALGVRDVACWGYKACAHMAYLRPKNAQKVWACVLRGMQSLACARA